MVARERREHETRCASPRVGAFELATCGGEITPDARPVATLRHLERRHREHVNRNPPRGGDRTSAEILGGRVDWRVESYPHKHDKAGEVGHNERIVIIPIMSNLPAYVCAPPTRGRARGGGHTNTKYI